MSSSGSNYTILVFSVSVRRQETGDAEGVRKWTDEVRSSIVREATAEFSYGLDGTGSRGIASLISGHVQAVEHDLGENFGPGRVTFVDEDKDCVLLDNYDSYREAAKVLIASAPEYSLQFMYDMTQLPIKRTLRSPERQPSAAPTEDSQVITNVEAPQAGQQQGSALGTIVSAASSIGSRIMGASGSRQSTPLADDTNTVVQRKELRSKPKLSIHPDQADKEKLERERDASKKVADAVQTFLRPENAQGASIEETQQICDNPDELVDAFNQRVAQEVEARIKTLQSESRMNASSVMSEQESFHSFDMAASLASLKEQVKGELRDELLQEMGSHIVPTVQSADDGDTIVSSVTLGSSVTASQRAAKKGIETAHKYPCWSEFYGVCQRCGESIEKRVHVVIDESASATHVCLKCTETWAEPNQLPVVVLYLSDWQSARRVAKTVSAVVKTYAHVCAASGEATEKADGLKSEEEDNRALANSGNETAVQPPPESGAQPQLVQPEDNETAPNRSRNSDSRSSVAGEDFELVDEGDNRDDANTTTGDDYDFASSVGVDGASVVESIACTGAGTKSVKSGAPPPPTEHQELDASILQMDEIRSEVAISEMSNEPVLAHVELKGGESAKKESTVPSLDNDVKKALAKKDPLKDELSELKGNFRRGVNNFVEVVSDAVQEHTSYKTGSLLRSSTDPSANANAKSKSKSTSTSTSTKSTSSSANLSSTSSKSIQTFASSMGGSEPTDKGEKWRAPTAWVPRATQTDESLPYRPGEGWTPPPTVACVSTTTAPCPIYADAMATLGSMGFNDTQLNARLLDEHKGDMAAVVAALCGDGETQ